MKFKFIFLAFIIFSVRAYSQSKNEISVVYGTDNNLVDIHDAIGDFGYNNKTGTAFGFGYTRGVTRLFFIETGLIYSNNKVELNSILPGSNANIDGNVKMITVPVLAKFTFLKYLFVDGGPLIDFETNYSNNNPVINDQSGIGFELGAGGEYTFGKYTIFINPFVNEHAMVKFNSTGNGFNLLEAGLKFGLGYNF